MVSKMLFPVALVFLFACSSMAYDLDLSSELTSKLGKLGFQPETLKERTEAFVELEFKKDGAKYTLKASTKEYSAKIKYDYHGIPLTGSCTINKDFTKKKCKVEAELDVTVEVMKHDKPITLEQTVTLSYSLDSKSKGTAEMEWEKDLGNKKKVTTTFTLTQDLKGLLIYNPLEKFFVGDLVKGLFSQIPELGKLGGHTALPALKP